MDSGQDSRLSACLPFEQNTLNGRQDGDNEVLLKIKEILIFLFVQNRSIIFITQVYLLAGESGEIKGSALGLASPLRMSAGGSRRGKKKNSCQSLNNSSITYHDRDEQEITYRFDRSACALRYRAP